MGVSLKDISQSVPDPGERDPLLREVWRRLDGVCDPELDEPITDMGFVEHVGIDDDYRVVVRFRLPTYWCSPNFAFLMASDIRREVGGLAWVSEIRVQLEDHVFGDQVNIGINEGRSFQEIFADLAPDEDLDEIREKFRKKAFQRRQEVLLLGLRGLGRSDDGIVALTFGEFDLIEFDEDDQVRQKSRYRDLVTHLRPAARPEDLAFCRYDGTPIQAIELGEYLSQLRGVRINMEFSGALCRGLLSMRYKELGRTGGEPTFVDFISGREV